MERGYRLLRRGGLLTSILCILYMREEQGYFQTLSVLLMSMFYFISPLINHFRSDASVFEPNYTFGTFADIVFMGY
jgi:hypothetical protein